MTEDLKQAQYALSTSVDQQGASATSEGGDDTTKDAGSGDDSVIDADFTESK